MRGRGLLWAFIVVVALFGVALFQGAIVNVLPDGLASLLRRNSEGYFMIVAMLIDTQVIGTSESRRRIWMAWIALLAVGWALTFLFGDDLGLSGAIITLNEPIAAALIVSLYLRLVPRRSAGITGQQVAFYVVVLGLVILGEMLPGGFNGGGVAAFLINNAETLAMCLLVGGLFDFLYPWPSGKVAPARTRVAWFVVLVALPVLYTSQNPGWSELVYADGLVPSALAWLQRGTEAFVAALGLSIYFELKMRVVGS